MRAPLNFPVSMMPSRGPQVTPVEFNARSKQLLAQVDPVLADLMFRVEAKHPDAFEITEGMRDAARQAQLVAEGKSQTYNSKHLTGNAVDIAMIGPDGKPNWDFEAYRPIADTAKAVAAEIAAPNFVWGGDWKSLRDGVHFQIGGNGAPPVESVGMGEQPLSYGPNVGPVTPQATGILPLDMGTEVPTEESKWKGLLSAATDLAKQSAPQAPQLMPMQRQGYTPVKRDTIAPLQQFLLSLR
jgi:peptidoglycan LD-endopeptidase CwlK